MKKIFSLLAAVFFAGSMMAAEVTDVLSSATTGVKGSNYAEWSGKNLSSEAVYAGQSAATNNTIQLRSKNNNSGVITTKSGGRVVSISVKFHSSTLAERVLDIYGSNTAYEATTDLYDESKAGELVASISADPSSDKTYTFTGNYTFIAFRSKKDALYLEEVKIVWETSGEAPKVATPVIAGETVFPDSTTVTITCATEGAVIYYTTDGVEPSSNSLQYAAPFTLSETATVKAVAYKSDEDSYSNVATKTFTKKDPSAITQYEVAEAIAAGLKENDEVYVRGVITKMEFKGKNFAKYGSVNIYVADATGAAGEFEFYNCFSLDADTFRTSKPNYDPKSSSWAQFREVADAKGNAIHVGDTVVAFGKYKLFNSTHELNTGCYLTEIKSAPVAPAQDIKVEMREELMFSDNVASAGWWDIYGENEKYVIEISNKETTQMEGTYTIDDLDEEYTYLGIINGNDTAYVTFVEGSVTLSKNAQEGTITVAGTLTGDDGNNYLLNLVFEEPKAEEVITVNILHGAMEDAYAEFGLYGLYGEDENGVFVALSIWAEEALEGEFTEQDLDFEWLGSGIIVGQDEESIYKASITVTPDNGDNDYNVRASVLCYSNKQYNVTMYVSGEGQGIEDVETAVKVLKRIVEGQLVIEKGGRTFNATGAVIR